MMGEPGFLPTAISWVWLNAYYFSDSATLIVFGIMNAAVCKVNVNPLRSLGHHLPIHGCQTTNLISPYIISSDLIEFANELQWMGVIWWLLKGKMRLLLLQPYISTARLDIFALSQSFPSGWVHWVPSLLITGGIPLGGCTAWDRLKIKLHDWRPLFLKSRYA